MSDECTIIVKVSHDDYVTLTKYAESDPTLISVNELVEEMTRDFIKGTIEPYLKKRDKALEKTEDADEE